MIKREGRRCSEAWKKKEHVYWEERPRWSLIIIPHQRSLMNNDIWGQASVRGSTSLVPYPLRIKAYAMVYNSCLLPPTPFPPTNTPSLSRQLLRKPELQWNLASQVHSDLWSVNVEHGVSLQDWLQWQQWRLGCITRNYFNQFLGSVHPASQANAWSQGEALNRILCLHLMPFHDSNM